MQQSVFLVDRLVETDQDSFFSDDLELLVFKLLRLIDQFLVDWNLEERANRLDFF